LIPWSSQT